MDAVFDHPTSNKGGAVPGDIANKHVTMRKAMQDRHEAEFSDLHKRHEAEHKKSAGMDGKARHEMHHRHAAERHAMHGRHEHEHGAMAIQQAAEMEGNSGGNMPAEDSTSLPTKPGGQPVPAQSAPGGALPTT
jgi:hypothetical protein